MADDSLLTAFSGPARMVDTVPNPDIDKAMGYDVGPDDGAGLAFAKGLQSSLFRNSQQGRDLSTAFAKQKLANELELQLEQRKMELAKQNPTYQFEKMPWGAITALNPKTGTGSEISVSGNNSSDPNSPAAQYKANWEAQLKAATAKANTEADPKYQQAIMEEAIAKPQQTTADINYKNETQKYYRQAQEDALRARAASAGQSKPKYATYKEALQDAEMESGINTKDPMFQMKLGRGDPAATQTMARIQSRAQELFGQQGAPNRGIAAPNTPPPDTSGLFSPLNVE